MSDGEQRRRLRRLVAVAAIGLVVLAGLGAVFSLSQNRATAWPLVAADLALTLLVLGLAWRSLR